MELDDARVGGISETGAAADPLAVVLQQELIRLARLLMLCGCCAGPSSLLRMRNLCRYRRLEAAVHDSLADLERALQGLAAMSTDLEQMSNSMSSDQVPTPRLLQTFLSKTL